MLLKKLFKKDKNRELIKLKFEFHKFSHPVITLEIVIGICAIVEHAYFSFKIRISITDCQVLLFLSARNAMLIKPF